MKVKSESEVAQSRPTLSDPVDCNLPGYCVHGFSRQEYWSGVPLPSLREEYEDHLMQTPSAGGWRVEEVLESISWYI